MAYEPELERLERRYQDDPARNFAQLAETYRKVGRLDDALTLLRGHLADRPNYVSGLVVLGRCLRDQDNDDEAREVFERVLGVDAEHIIALRALGEIAERGGDVAGAKQWFARLLDIDPMNEDAEAAMARLAAAPEAPAAPIVEEPVEPAPSVVDEMRAELAAEPEAPSAPPAPPTPPFEPAEIRDAAFTPRFGDSGYPEPEAMELAPPPEPAAEEETVSAGSGQGVEDPEYFVEEPTDAFLPRAASTEPLEFEQIGHVEFSSQLPDEEALLSVPEEEPEEPSLPTGEREVDLGSLWAGETGGTDQSDMVGAGFEPTAMETPGDVPPAQDLGAQPFDDALGWGAGERISRQISSEDIAEAEKVHEDGLETPVQELPGLETTEMPADADAAVPVVEGLEAGETLADVVPLDGLEPTASEEGPTAEIPTHPAEPADAGSLPYLATVGADDDTEPTVEIVSEEVAPVELGASQADETMPMMLEAPLEAEAAVGEPQPEAEAVAGGGDSRAAERRASLMGLPLIDEPTTPDAPLVLDAQPEPVVTETMAELYVRQGLMAEARDVYEQLLRQRPGDPKLQARLTDLGRPGARQTAFAAADTGGASVRAMLLEVLASRPGAPAAAAVVPAPPAVVPAVPSPTPPDPMEEAFGSSPEGEPPEEPSIGAPTKPASDEVSLAAIFGDPGAPAEPAKPAVEEPRPAPGGRTPGGFSFDEFFGKPVATGTETADKSRRDTLADDEGDEAFKDWLKSLKS